MEKYENNNNVFNGKYLSDGSSVSGFYSSKINGGKGGKGSEMEKNIKNFEKDPRTSYTANIINQLHSANSEFTCTAYPSNLVEVPKIGEKYEVGSFKRTMGQMKALDL